MSTLIVIAAEMHKIANFHVNVKHRHSGNIVEYIPVEFEIFEDGKYLKAIPQQCLQTKALLQLPNELLFAVKEGKICHRESCKDEITADIVDKLVKMNIVELS